MPQLDAGGDLRMASGLALGATSVDPANGQPYATVQASGWLPVATFACLPSAISVSNQYPFVLNLPRDVYVTTWYQGRHIATTNDGSNYWQVYLRRLTDNAIISSWNTSTVSPGSWSYRSATINAPYTAADIGFYIQVNKVGSPGALSLTPPAVYAR